MRGLSAVKETSPIDSPASFRTASNRFSGSAPGTRPRGESTMPMVPPV